MKNEPINPLAVYNAEETGELLKVDKRAVYKLINNGELTARQIGNKNRILGESILSYMGSVTFSGNADDSKSP